MTISALINTIKHCLSAAGYPETEIQAITRILLQYHTGLRIADIYINMDKEVADGIPEQINAALNRLAKHEPLQYVLGETEFYGLRFTVNKNVLIPRPETEELVHWVINDYKSHTPFSILDIGTGSGAIAVALAKNLPQARVFALDISGGALNMAQKNAELNNTDVQFIHADILDDTINLPQTFDCIVSNPPYVLNSEKQLMQKNVLDYEPHNALFVDDNNALVFYKAVAYVAKQWLNKNGNVYVEINESLPAETAAVFKKQGFTTSVKNDINGKPRMIKAIKP